MTDDPRDALAARLGVIDGYHDPTGAWHATGPETRDAILAAMGEPVAPDEARDRLDALTRDDATRPLPPWVVVGSGRGPALEGLAGRDWRLIREDGVTEAGQGPELPILSNGIHRLEVGGHETWLLAAPERLPDAPRGWGITLPLYGLAGDGRIGSYADLRMAVERLGHAGAGFVGINPIHAGFPTDTDAISPYAPSHRGRLAVHHIAPRDEPGQAAGDLIDYAAAQPGRMDALRAEFDADPGAGFQAWWAARDADLERFALHQALSARLGPRWSDWPAPYRRPDSPEVAEFARAHANDCAFHGWLQWRADAQLVEVRQAAEAAGMAYGLYLDLAVGTHPHGAETWGRPDLFARGVSLGAPPDAFSAGGQSWGLAPLHPLALARDGFRPLAAILQRQFAHARLLRIDHILGFDRAFWVPEQDGVPGAYVRMPREALLAVARIEAARAGGTVVGEDLGNIPDGLQHVLWESRILGCRVAQFEQDWDAEEIRFKPADRYAPAALTSFSTHDLPTWEGWKAGRDIAWRRDLGDISEDGAREARARRNEEVARLTELIGGAGVDDLHAFLARTPSWLIAVQIEDLLGRLEQANLPGTIHQHPNWRRRIGMDPAKLGQLDAVARTADIMRDHDR
ncbi:4-alpha-glucanotransferase [Palleronia sediminis]|uniref:4-alpha-glucanotransferase n=1 Tax=Palleronia sediminis TaxID=2547833 RepID=A0A4R6AK12_9RHOB|nr:4-alpha-glucanotransferase [Palleronia sediminis]TDL83705.1 4-alpha-glucanotransferase [Palleronia sediminis]